MSKYNSTVKSGPKAINFAGGKAYEQSNKLAIASFLFTSFLTDTYYRTESEEMKRLKEMFQKETDKEFIAKAALFTRNEYGMRSVSHLATSLLAKDISGKEFARRFYSKIVRRPDDMMEILGAYAVENGMDLNHIRKIPNAMKRGFADAIGRMDAYQLAKYKKEGSAISMLDVINLVHPKSTDKNAKALKALVVDGDLKNERTWEAKVSKAGSVAKNKKEKKELKTQAWKEMLIEGSIGYDALLQNLRNIAETKNDELIEMAVKLVTDKKRIDKSLTMPFKYYVAYRNLFQVEPRLANAVSKALNMCLRNIPKLPGKTVVLVDTSGSMTMNHVAKSDVSVAEAAALFGVAINKAMGADVKWFHGSSGPVYLNPEDSITTGIGSFEFRGGRTFLDHAIESLSPGYDNLIVISDMQCYSNHMAGFSNRSLNDYRRRSGKSVTMFSLDLAGSGTMQFPEGNVVCMAGFSDKIFSSMAEITMGPQNLIKQIEAVEL